MVPRGRGVTPGRLARSRSVSSSATSGDASGDGERQLGKNGEESEIADLTAVMVIRLTAGETHGSARPAFP